MSSHDLAEQFDQKSKEHDILLSAQQEVEQAILQLRRQIIGLQSQKSELDIAKSKATYNVRMCKNDMDRIKNMYFKMKTEGL